MDDLSRFCCPNSQCLDFGLRDAGNLTVTGRLGKFRQYRLLYCRTCRARFSERKGTPLYRATCLRTRSSRSSNTSTRAAVSSRRRDWSMSIPIPSATTAVPPAHARDAHRRTGGPLASTRDLQMDEKWSFVAKKEKNCDEDDPEDQFRGDCWDHVAFDPEHRLVVSVVPGERTGESIRELVTDVKERIGRPGSGADHDRRVYGL